MRTWFSRPLFFFMGLPLMTAAGLMAADLFYFHWTRELQETELVVVRGTVESTKMVPPPESGWLRKKAKGYVELRLAGQEHPFRFDPEWASIITPLARGTPVRVSMDPDVMKQPLKPGLLNRQPSYWPLLLRLQDGWHDVRLSRHNENARGNLHSMPWLSLLLALMGLGMSTQRFARYLKENQRLKYQPRRKPLKGRLKLRC